MEEHGPWGLMSIDDDDDGGDEDDDDFHADWLCGWWLRGHK